MPTYMCYAPEGQITAEQKCWRAVINAMALRRCHAQRTSITRNEPALHLPNYAGSYSNARRA
jgi:hypothetical protein